jgi:hypothetical protein
MYVPEKEAKYKYCPLLTTRDDKMRFCQATMCMMWRFKDADKRDDSDPGYCGLAGKPVGMP